MLQWLARHVIKDAWIVVGAWAAVALVCLLVAGTGLGGGNLFERLSPGDAAVEGTESAQGQQVLDTLSGDGTTVNLLITGVSISTPAQREAVSAALADAHKDLRTMVGDGNVLDPFVVPGGLSEAAAQVLAAKDLDGFLMIVTVDPNGSTVLSRKDRGYQDYIKQRDALVSRVEARLAQVPDSLTDVDARATGIVSDHRLTDAAVNDQVERDLLHGEAVSLPLALLVMVLVFGGFLAAGMPLIGALASIASTLGVLWALSLGTDLQSFVGNIVSVIGLGLSIDYGLLITSRYREELARAHAESQLAPGGQGRRQRAGRRDPVIVDCMTTTLRTAGRTVLFSALTVAVSMLGLLVMGTSILYNIGLAGLAVVLLSVAAALTLVPAVLVIFGRRMVGPSVLQRVPGLGALQRRLGDVTSHDGVFATLARRVHAHPWYVLAGCLTFLVVLCLPLGGLHLLSSTTELLPEDSSQREYLEELSRNYPSAAQQDATLIMAGTGESVTTFINTEVATAPGVTSVLRSATAGQYTVVYLDLEGDPSSRTAEAAVSALRALNPPYQTWVTGQAATQLDFRETIFSGLPWALGLIVVSTFVLLFLMTGSVLVPLKALVVNALSLAASLGVLAWIFQGGHGARLLGFTPIGGVETYVLVTALGVGFGLAMDYEVFLLARVKEYWDEGEGNDAAVEKGLQRSGRVVTSAALIMVTVFLGFVTGDMLVIKELGVAMAVIVALDATVVRMLLVPATMTLLGHWNWWAPARLTSLYERYGIRE